MEYVVAVIVSLTLISILFFLLRSTVKRIDINTKKYFIDKLQDYDYLIEEKKKILDDLNKKIEEQKDVLDKEQKEENKNNNINKNEYYGEISIPKYKDDNLFEKYKEIKEKFSFDKEELIRKFIKNLKNKDDVEFNTMFNIRKKFNSKKIYDILKLQPDEQQTYIYTMLDPEEIKIIKKYIKNDNIEINSFIIEMDTLLEKNDPVVYVYTGEKNKNYDYISPMIKTEYDEIINEGIKIKYKGNLYDFSL